MTAAQHTLLRILGHVRNLALVLPGERTSISGLPASTLGNASSKKARISFVESFLPALR